jgi:hypothetical protein
LPIIILVNAVADDCNLRLTGVSMYTMGDVRNSWKKFRSITKKNIINRTSISRISALLIISVLLCQCSAGNDTFYSGQQHSFSTPFDDNYIYRWDSTAGTYSDNTNSNFSWTAPAVTEVATVSIGVTVSSKDCDMCKDHDSIEVTVLPIAITGPANQAALEGEPVSFAVSLEPEGTYNYIWQVKRPSDADFMDISPEATSSSYGFEAKLDDDGNQYRALVEGDFGLMTSDTASLSVKPLPKAALGVSITANMDPVEAGQVMQYTIQYVNEGHSEVHGVGLKETYDTNTEFISADPMPDSNNDLWTIGDLKPGESASISIMARVNPDVKDNAELKNVVNMFCEEKATAEAIAITIAKNAGNKLVVMESQNSTNLYQAENATDLSKNLQQNYSETAPIENVMEAGPSSENSENIRDAVNSTTHAESINDSATLDLHQNDIGTNSNSPENGTEQIAVWNLPEADQANKSQFESDAKANLEDDTLTNDHVAGETLTVQSWRHHRLQKQVPLLSEVADDENTEIDSSSAEDNLPAATGIIEPPDKNTAEDTATLSFGDGINIDVVFELGDSLLGAANVVVQEAVKELIQSSSSSDGTDIALSTNATNTSLIDSESGQSGSNATQTQSANGLLKMQIEQHSITDLGAGSSSPEVIVADAIQPEPNGDTLEPAINQTD